MGICVMYPKKGQKLFQELVKGLGYEDAKQVFLKGISPKFIEDHKDTLSLDTEGIPTRESLLKTQYMKDLLGNNRIAKNLQAQYKNLEDNDANYNVLLNQANSFNNDSQYKDEFVAIVEYKNDGKIGLSVYPKTQELLNKSREQYASFQLNNYLTNEFANLGITVGELSTAEQAAGRVGVTDFSKVAGIARDFGSVIRASKNMEGVQAISEEWSHMIVRALKNKGNVLIQRAIKSLSRNENALKEILGKDFNDVLTFHEGNLEQVAEEAVGHILRDNLVQEQLNKNVPNKSLINRVKTNILSEFKEHDHLDIERAIIEAQYSMKEVAQQIMSQGINLDQKDIENLYSEEQFNALSDRIERGLDILKEARKVEAKRKKIYGDKQVQAGNTILDDEQALIDIREHLVEDPDVIGEGVLKYAAHANKMLKSLLSGLQNVDRTDPNKLFPLLVKIKLYVDSYGKFIHALSNMYQSELREDDDVFIKSRTIDGQEVDFQGIIKDLSYYSETLMSQYVEVGIPAFAEVLKPFLGENLLKELQQKYKVEDVVQYLLERSPGDITVFDRWLDSLGDSSDVILQLFDAKVKEVKDQERFKSIDDIKFVQKLMRKAEQLGITTFEWVFEKYNNGDKTGEYVSAINIGQFRKDQSEFFAYLADKYGQNPTGQAAKDMLAERDAWIAEHCASKFLINQPNINKYRNQAYENLPQSHKDLLEEFLLLKNKYDIKLPDGRAYKTKAIQRRKSGAQRFLDSLSSPTSIYENAKEAIKDTFLDAEDDDSIFGTSGVTKGIKGFDGMEFMNLPIVFTSRLNNPNELSTDIFGDLCAYIHMANTYESMSKVIDTLEVGKTLIQARDVTQTRGGNKMVETIQDLGTTLTSFINKGKSNQAAKIQDYMRSQVYQRYMVDHGAIGKFNTSKTVNFFLKLGNQATMAFNWLADSANVANAVIMQNIEAFCGEYFSPGQLLEADKEYAEAMLSFIPEIASRIKTNKLSLVNELLNIRQDFSDNTKKKLKKSLAERVLGTNWGSIGQDAGNHWLMSRTAIAYMSKIKVRVPGQGIMSLWKALTVVDKFEDDSGIKEVILPEGTTLEDGGTIDLAKIGREIAQINHGVLGIYNQDDSNAASQVALGRALLQYRKWMKSILNKRFQLRRENVLMDSDTEGFYITVLKLGRDLIRSKFQIGAVWDELGPMERKNLKRALTEVVQLLSLWCLVNLADWPDDEDRPWAVKYAQYMATRELKELQGVTPFGLRELGKTIKEPFPIYRQIDSTVALIYSLLDPRDYYTEVQSGPYKGLTVLEKNLLKSPMPAISQWRQIERATNGLEEAMQWYVKP